MANDPFAPKAADEAQAEPVTEAPKKTAPRKAAAKKIEMVDDPETQDLDGFGVSVTLKAGHQFDAPWFVIRTNTVSEMYEAFTGADAWLIPELMARIGAGAEKFREFFSSAAPEKSFGGGGGSFPKKDKPEPVFKGPKGEERYCKHGPMEFKSGVSKAGKAYELFSCTGPRAEQCNAQYLD